MNNDNDTKCQILSDEALNEKNQILERLKSQFSQKTEDNHGCGYGETNDWNPFIRTPTFDILNVYKNQQKDLYNSILDSISGKISLDIEVYEITDWTNPHRILHPIDLPCLALRYIGKPINSTSDRIILGEITGFVYRKSLQSTNKYFNLKLPNQESPKYILDISKSSNLLRFISNSSLGPLFSHKTLSPNVMLHTIYIDNWPHIIVTTIPGVKLSTGAQLIADFSALQPDINKKMETLNVYNGLSLKNQDMIIPVLGIPLGTTVKSTINKVEVVGKVADFVERNNEKLVLVNYPDGDYELYTRMALMIKLLKEYLKDSKLDQLLVPLPNLSDKSVNRKGIDAKKAKSRSDRLKSKSMDKSKPFITNHNLNKSAKKSTHKTPSKLSDKSPNKTSLVNSVVSDGKTRYTINDTSLGSPTTVNKDSNISIITRSRRSLSSDISVDSVEYDTKLNNNTTVNAKPTPDKDATSITSKNNINSVDIKPNKKSKKIESTKIFEPVSFRRNSPQEIKEKVPLTTLKDYCIDTLLELSRTRKNWRDSDNRKQFNFHFAKISNAKAIEDLEPQFTQVFYKLYQYVDLTISNDKVTFDAVGSCEKENPQLIEHLLELLTNIYSDNHQ